MNEQDGFEKIHALSEQSGRYKPGAFLFVLQSLEHCRRMVHRAGHVSGQELVEAARVLAKEQYGPMAKTVLNHWGIESTDDIGAVVFLMVDHGLLSKTAEDSAEDFRARFDFETEFVRNYRW